MTEATERPVDREKEAEEDAEEQSMLEQWKAHIERRLNQLEEKIFGPNPDKER